MGSGSPWDLPGIQSIDGIVKVDTGLTDLIKTWESNELEPATRKEYVTIKLLGIHGYTDGCQGCNYLKGKPGQGGKGRVQPSHSAKCRNRIETEMQKTYQGRKKLADREEKMKAREEVRQGKIVSRGERIQEAKEQEAARKEAADKRTRDRSMDKDDDWPKGRARRESKRRRRTVSSGRDRRIEEEATGGEETRNETPTEFFKRLSGQNTSSIDETPAEFFERLSDQNTSSSNTEEEEKDEDRTMKKRKRTEESEEEERKTVRKLFALIKGEYFDDTSGKRLDGIQAPEARKKEIDNFRKMQAYTEVPVSECLEKTGKAPIKVRWIAINKGDERAPNYRSRLVGKEIKNDNRMDLFAATPPLESLKFILSDATTGWDRKSLSFVDVSRAYFYAKARRDVCVEIPSEDWEEGDDWRCGKLNLSMYGTRDAAQNWEACYQEAFKSLGFESGQAST